MKAPYSYLIPVFICCLLLGCDRESVDTYKSSFKDSLRAEFPLGTGRVEHQRIDEYLRMRRIGFVDGTMWSGTENGADYTDLRLDLKKVDPYDLIDELMDQKMIGGTPTWFINDAEIKITN
jgi:hypothetical protein